MNLRPIAPSAVPLPPSLAERVRPAATAEAAAAEAAAPADVLTPAEREFFARLEALGPLTYRPGPARNPAPAAPTGQRLDVRG